MATSTIDFSDLGGKVVARASGTMDFSDLGGKVVSNNPAAQSQAEQGHQNRMSLLAGLPGALPIVNMTPEDKESWEQGKAAGAVSVPRVAGATAAGPSGMVTALAPLVKKYEIKALEGAGLGAGYDLYRDLKKVFEGQ
jgi:hypothetical protein